MTLTQPLPWDKIVKEIGKDNSEKILNDIKNLQKWIESCPHLRANSDPEFLLAFLRERNYDLEMTKQRIDNYYTFRIIAPEIFKNRDPRETKFRNLIEKGIFCKLPNPLPIDGTKVFVYRPRILNETNVNAIDLFKCAVMACDFLIPNDKCLNIAGGRIIIDFTGWKLDLKFLLSIKLGMLKKAVMLFEDCYPYRIQSFHLVKLNEAPAGVLPIVKTILSVISDKLRQKVYYHDSFDSLYEHIPKTNLPFEYGGSAGKLDELTRCEQIALLNSCKYFKDDQKYGTDESKRIGKSQLLMDKKLCSWF